MGLFLNNWKDASAHTIQHAFLLDDDEMQGMNILLASYATDLDSGYAFVLFERDGQLYEVHASHDSEMDFADQWEPEETSLESLKFRMQRGNLGSSEAGINIFRNELEQVLSTLTRH